MSEKDCTCITHKEFIAVHVITVILLCVNTIAIASVAFMVADTNRMLYKYRTIEPVIEVVEEIKPVVKK